MAELLIRAANNNTTHANAEIEFSGAYKRGDIVVVKPDGWQWGSAEGLPIFVKVKIPGLAVNTAESWIVRQVSGADPTITVKRRLWGVKVESIPIGIRNELLANGEVTVTLTQIRNFIENKVTLETA
jgi:hypothetical protein